jgi:L-rhamnose mutarotase
LSKHYNWALQIFLLCDGKAHAIDAVCPEIIRGIQEAGIFYIEIYIHGNRLFMIIDTVPGFDRETAMAELSTRPRQDE